MWVDPHGAGKKIFFCATEYSSITVLDLVIFRLYNNDSYEEVCNSTIILYAEDAELYEIINSANECLEMINDIPNIEYWGNECKMKINIGKCEMLTVEYNSSSLRSVLDGVYSTYKTWF